MKKNEETTQVEETKLIWKLKDLPDAESVASLVETKVITPEEARSILFREEVKQSDEVEAYKEMVKTLQDMVKELLARPNGIQYVPYTKVIEVPARSTPYWNTWMGNTTLTSTAAGSSPMYVTSRSNSAGDTVYTISVK